MISFQKLIKKAKFTEGINVQKKVFIITNIVADLGFIFMKKFGPLKIKSNKIK